MGSILHGIWINYTMRLHEPQWYGPPEVVEKCLSYMEEHGGEDKTFREYVKDLCAKNDDAYWTPDKRKYNFLTTYMDSKASLRDVPEYVSWRERIIDWQAIVDTPDHNEPPATLVASCPSLAQA